MALTQLPDAKERFALGQQCRKRMRRLEHKTWKAKDRRESPLALLAASTRGRVSKLVVLKNGRYDNVPIETVISTKKVVNVKEHYNTKRLRPHYASFEMKPLFIMTSESA